MYMRFAFGESPGEGRFGYQRPDLQKAGGLLDARKIVDMADTHTTPGCKDMRGARPAKGYGHVP